MNASSVSKGTAATGGSVWTAPRVRIIGFCALCALPFILAFDLGQQFSHFVLSDDTFAYLPLIPLVSGFFIYQNRKTVFADPSTSMLAALPVAVGLFFALLLRFGTLALSPANRACGFSVALVLTWTGAFGLCFGKNAVKAARFPLSFLIFAIPIPDPPLSRIISFLQYASADVAELFFRLAGVPYLRQDLIFRLPGVSIRVAEECSGIRSSLALLITTVMASYLFLRTTWRRVVLWLAVVPLAIFKNGLRIMVLSTLAIYVNPGFLTGNLHHHGGVVFFAVAVVVMGLFFFWLQKGEQGPDSRPGGSRIAPRALARPPL